MSSLLARDKDPCAGLIANMPPMFVTWDVTKLSGWLKSNAHCRVERRACESEGAGARAWGSGSTSDAHGRTRLGGCGGRVRVAERTPNMYFIVVTLDVSKFTGWLNLYAACRVEKAGHAMRGEVWGPESGGARAWGSG